MNRIKDEVESEIQRLEDIRIRKIKHREEAQTDLIDIRHRILEIQEKIVKIREKFNVPSTPLTPSTPLNIHEMISPELPSSLPNIYKKQLELFEGRLYKLEDEFEKRENYINQLDNDFSKLEKKLEQNRSKIKNISKIRRKQRRESKRSGFDFCVDYGSDLGSKRNNSPEGDTPDSEDMSPTEDYPSFDSILKGPNIHQHVIAGILFCEFEKEKGSRIKFQVPPECVSEEEFEHFAKYITGTEVFCNEILAFSYKNRFFLGLPKVLRHERYPRNLFLFNVVFVFNKPVPEAPPVNSPHSDTPFTPRGGAIGNKFDTEIRKMKSWNTNTRGFQIGKIMLLFVPILKKLSDTLYTLEEQKQMLSAPDRFRGAQYKTTRYKLRSTRVEEEEKDKKKLKMVKKGKEIKVTRCPVLEEALTKFYVEINCTFERESHLRFDDTMFVHFKLLPHSVQPSPPHLHPHYVPIPLFDLSQLVDDDSDLSFQQIYRHLDGRNHIQAIVEKSGVVIRLVYKCIKNLLYYNVVKIIDLFQYSNIYGLRSQDVMVRLFTDREMQQKCYDFVVLHSRKFYLEETLGRKKKKERKKMKHPWTESEPLNSSTSSPRTSSPLGFSRARKSSNAISPLQVVKIYTYFNSRDSLGAVLRRIPPEYEISHRALITFGVVHGILVRIHEIPILDENFETGNSNGHNFEIRRVNSREFLRLPTVRNRSNSGVVNKRLNLRSDILNRRPETPPLSTDSPRTNKYSKRTRGRGEDDRGEAEREMRKRERFFSTLRMFLNGNHCLDEICCHFHMHKDEMKERMKNEYGDSIYIVRKIMNVGGEYLM